MKINSEVKGFFINGASVPITDTSFTWNNGGKSRAEVMGVGRVLGYTESNVPGEAGVNIAYGQGTSPRDYEVVDAQIRVVWDVGAEWLIKNAFSTEPASGSAGDGTFALSWKGDPWIITKK